MLTQERLKEVLSYNPETGEFTRRSTGKRAGSKNKRSGYNRVGIDNKVYLAGRLAWLYMTGSMPKDTVDHINRVSDDDRWCNLREASVSENCCNRVATNSHGFKGVFRVSKNRFAARIAHLGKKLYLGTFLTPELAHAAYCAKAKELHGEFANAG